MKTSTRRRTASAWALGALLAAGSVSGCTTQAVADEHSGEVSASEMASAGYEELATRLLAGILDSSYGPTLASFDGRTVPAPGSVSALQTSSTTDYAAWDVDARAERQQDPTERAAAIGQVVPLSDAALAEVASLIERCRSLEEQAAPGFSDVDIVTATVETAGVEATVADTTGDRLVKITSHLTEHYRSGVVSEAYDDTYVTFDATTGEVLGIRPATDSGTW
ncbi:hypothetical protein [Demequina capsici]|uniref:Lipoprotein n=1 Tax=Demequina capsici TaxID=3075620 RepID=A0AA96F6F4_9MICO|nr:hypothetical protein [Demequina sp. OYTSA14]WNM24427.1 hypothetical protein RN606_13845 [Demequina sp. OYTSA14]